MEQLTEKDGHGYAFARELPCLIELVEANGLAMGSRQGQARLLELGPRECRMESALDFRVPVNDCKIVLSFRLTRELSLRGTMVSQEPQGKAYRYGIRLEDAEGAGLEDELMQYDEWKMLQSEGIVASPD